MMVDLHWKFPAVGLLTIRVSKNTTKITPIAGDMPKCSEFSMQFYHQRFPSSALTDRSIYTGKNLFRINGWGPLATSATVCVYKFNEIHAIVGQMPNWTEFSMQFDHQRFPSSALIYRSIYTLKILFRINGWGPLATFATVWVYKSNENHATGRVHALQEGIFNAILPSALPVVRIDWPFDLYTEKLVRN